ncbi:hypothetical protein C8Q80DRAFT_82730 [Daedaleopsis nitida]|nr:hypothetical protein C8Q80DRAFT_82730 [Daedaleopsis nitida]
MRWKALKSKEEKAQYLDERSKFVAQCSHYEKQFKRWEQVLMQNQLQKERECIKKRYTAILAQLRKEGWDDEVNHMQADQHKRMYALNVINLSKKFTDKEWETIRGPVVEVMREIRAARQTGTITTRLQYLKATLYAHQSAVPVLFKNAKDRLYAGFADIAFVPEVRAMIEEHSPDVTEDVIKAKIAAIVPELAERWVDERRAQFTALLREGLGDSIAADAPNPLELAIASFKCIKCADRDWYSYSPRSPCYGWPEIAEHYCLRNEFMDARCGDYYMGHVSNLVNRHPNDTPFKGVTCVQVMKELTDFRDVIEVCGQDPDTVTYDHMEHCGVRLRCRLCASFARQEVFDWKAAIRHDFDAHPWLKNEGLRTRVEGRWERISNEHARQAEALEAALALKLPGTNPSIVIVQVRFHCGWCGFSSEYSPVILDHLRSDHDKQSEVYGQDYYGVRSSPLTIWMYSETLSHCPSLQVEVAAGKAFFASFKV